MKIHPSDEILEELATKPLTYASRGADRRLTDHVERCEPCRARMVALRRSHSGKLTDRFARLLGLALAPSTEPAGAKQHRLGERCAAILREREAVAGLWSELAACPDARRQRFLHENPRLWSWALLERLLEESRDGSVQSPTYGEAMAFLALEMTSLLDADLYGADELEDMQARAWGYIGNARRVRSDLQGAEEAFAEAYQHLLDGTRDPMERAKLLDLKASLLRDKRRFDDALRLIRRAVSIFLAAGERHRAGRALLNLATIHHDTGNPEVSIPVLYQALELIDPEREPRLLLSARHNLIGYLVEASRFMEAHTLFVQTRPLYRKFDDPWTQNRYRWIQGMIARGLEQPKEAEAFFLAAREGFVAEGIPYDTALVSLELAMLYVEQGRMAELKRIAAEMVVIFSSRQIHREALAAIAFFRQAVQTEKASLDLLRQVASFLEKAQHNPELRFESPFVLPAAPASPGEPAPQA
jgi:tetratricopeptide (TPR) repeat protein